MMQSNQPYQRVTDPTMATAGIGAGIGGGLGLGAAGFTHFKSAKFRGMGWKGKTAGYLGSALVGGGLGFFGGGVAGSYLADTNQR